MHVMAEREEGHIWSGSMYIHVALDKQNDVMWDLPHRDSSHKSCMEYCTRVRVQRLAQSLDPSSRS